MVIIRFIITCLSVVNYAHQSNQTLQLIHVIFRHGDRTNIIEPEYITNPYINEQYCPYGYGELTKKGMLRAYKLGKYIHQRYNETLNYKRNVVVAVCSESNRAQATLQLVLAGIFPPKNTNFEWTNELNWLPIPFKSLAADTHILSFPNTNCKNHEYYYSLFLETDQGKKVMKKYADVFQYLSKQAGGNISTLLLARSIYYSLLIENEWGFVLPEWTDSIFPEILENMTLDYFYASAGTKKLKQLTGGFLLKKIIDNTLRELKNISNKDATKIFLYSGHEYNIIYLMLAIKVIVHKLPPYTASLIIEVHTINSITGLKIFYEDFSNTAPEALKIPGCDYFCPLTNVISLLKENIPGKGACNEKIVNIPN